MVCERQTIEAGWNSNWSRGLIVADLEVRPAALQHLQPFGDDAREPDEVADDVGAPARG